MKIVNIIRFKKSQFYYLPVIQESLSALINKTNHENTKINTRKPQMVVSLVSLEDLILYLSLHHIGALTIEVTSPFLIFEIITLFHLKKYSYYYYSRKLTILELIIVFTLMIHLYLIEKKKSVDIKCYPAIM